MEITGRLTVGFKTLYKRTSTGKTEQWRIWTEENTIYTEHGQVGGKLQLTQDVIKEGKNLGKANATTAVEQARAEAAAKWTKQKERKGYVEDADRAQAGETDQEGGIAPMLAHTFADHGDKLRYPLYAQPKLDGIRCIAMVTDTGVTLWSRTRKQILSVNHIAEAVAAIGLKPGTVLDGELYNHDLKADFEKIVSVVRKNTPAPLEVASKIQYHIYDIPSDTGGFADRLNRLQAIQNIVGRDGALRVVHTLPIKDEEELLAYMKASLLMGFEGCMARSATTRYENKRSYSLLKLKEFQDSEYPIVGVEEGRGKMAGCAIFVCKTADGTEFKAKLEGDLESLRPYLEYKELWTGKALTVQYQGLTGKSKVPRFPVGKAVRDYE